MLTEQEKTERNQVLKKDFGLVKCNLNEALLRRLNAITNEAARGQGKAIFEPVDSGKETFIAVYE